MQIKISKIEHPYFTVKTPYNPRIVKRMHELGGEWAGDAWIVSESEVSLVRDALLEIFGSAGDDDIVTVEIEFSEDVSALMDSVYAGPFPVARAAGRDTGARVEKGVIVVAGEVTSGGSKNNWKTVISAGTTLRIKKVNRGVAKKFGWKIIEAEIEAEARTEQLQSERCRLLARVAEIDAQLLATAK